MGGTGIMNVTADESMAEFKKLGIIGKSNIVLIGMPASGKSTVGVILAKMLGMDFLDTDLVIQQREHALLCEIIEQRGVESFLKCEESAVLSVCPVKTVIATGGSVVYSEKLMHKFSNCGLVIYLKDSVDTLSERLGTGRRIIGSANLNFAELYKQRDTLYTQYAHKIIDCSGHDTTDIAKMIKTEVM
jgi:shikimate kinase